ncbi:MAG: hypothetical protein KDE03_14985 [Rhodobacteraceae bacterium]|nr:hypothetical protein [Paracoccaceae bacterium]
MADNGDTPAGTHEGPVLARIEPAPSRRVLASGTVGAFGLLLIALGFFRPPAAVPLQLFLITLGGLSLLLAGRVYRATSGALVLTETGIRDGSGRTVARLDDIAGVDRGVFAFKPSNGFVLRLKSAQSKAWAPGLWWRLGKRVGVGGAISGAEGRQMADALSALLARRD